MGYTNIVNNIIFGRMWGRKMRKEYEKPILEVVDFDLSDSNWWQL